MRTVIVIDCEEESEVLYHLNIVRQQIKRAFKSNKEGDFAVKDSNCYGDHKATICYDRPEDYEIIINENYLP